MSGRTQLVVPVVLVALAVLFLAGCSGPSRGTVHDRDYTPAHTTYTTSCQTVGKSTICHPVPIYVGDDYELDIYATTDDHGWVEVDQHTYDTCPVGAYYDKGVCR